MRSIVFDVKRLPIETNQLADVNHIFEFEYLCVCVCVCSICISRAERVGEGGVSIHTDLGK